MSKTTTTKGKTAARERDRLHNLLVKFTEFIEVFNPLIDSGDLERWGIESGPNARRACEVIETLYDARNGLLSEYAEAVRKCEAAR